jgi:hypothetical protein
MAYSMDSYNAILSGNKPALIEAVRRGDRLTADQRQLIQPLIGVVRRIYGFKRGEVPEYMFDDEHMLKDPAAREQLKMLLRIYDEEVDATRA